MGWTLADIREKVRKITGRRSTAQLSNTVLDDYINDFIEYELPAELKLDKQRVFFDFQTVKNQKDYTYTNYTNVQPEIYVEGLEIRYYQDFNFFLSAVPQAYQRETVGSGNGATTAFSGTLDDPPLSSGLVLFTDDVETFTDTDGDGNLTGSEGGSGTINYASGTWSISFNTAPTSGQNIYASYLPIATGLPTDALVFNDRIQFYPLPDSAYQVRVVAFKIPPRLTSSSSTPELQEWGPMIAVGTARQIFLDNGETDRLAEIEPSYREKKKLSMRRVTEQMNYERAAPRF